MKVTMAPSGDGGSVPVPACHCGATVYAPKLGPRCEILNGPGSGREESRRGGVT